MNNFLLGFSRLIHQQKNSGDKYITAGMAGLNRSRFSGRQRCLFLNLY